MPISSLNPMYDASKSTLTQNANDGDVLKYVPRLTGQTDQEYRDYQSRATYYNLTERTNNALTGAMLRKPYMFSETTDDVVVWGGLTFDELLSESISDTMTNGRIGTLVDFDDVNQTPYIVSYKNGSITNWRMANNMLVLVILREDTFVPKDEDPYEVDHVVVYRELFLDAEGFYAVRIWTQQGIGNAYAVTETIIPTIRGERLSEIPFTFINTKTTTPEVTPPTLYNIAQINVSHFKTSADIEHSAHFTALPQPWISGDLKEETSQLPIGTYTVWQLEEGATVDYLEFSGSGIGALQNIAVSKENQMAALGAQLLQGKKNVESADALRLRQGSEASTLSVLATSIENGMARTLSLYFSWLNGTPTTAAFTLSRDFLTIKLGATELKALMDAYLAQTISQDTFLTNLFEGEVVDDVEEEKSRLPAVTSTDNTNIPTNGTIL